jgi:hypothetical protein
MGRKTQAQKDQEVTEITFPEEVYPVLYKSYYTDFLNPLYKLEANTTGVLTSYMIDVYREYYNLQFDINTLTQITYDNTPSPYHPVFIVRYKGSNGQELYLWEYFGNWMAIKELNTTKWI